MIKLRSSSLGSENSILSANRNLNFNEDLKIVPNELTLVCSVTIAVFLDLLWYLVADRFESLVRRGASYWNHFSAAIDKFFLSFL